MNKRTSILDLHEKKNASKIVVLTCYTAQLAKILDNHVDILLVGDSLGMTIYGHNNTLSVTKRMMIDHAKCVVENSSKALVVVDMPFGTYESDKIKAFDVASEIISRTNANAVKVEGGKLTLTGPKGSKKLTLNDKIFSANVVDEKNLVVKMLNKIFSLILN